MRWRVGIAGALMAGAMAACAPVPGAEPTAIPTATAGSQQSPVELPMPFPLEYPVLDGGAALAVRQLMAVSDNQPALKLDVTETQVTLTVLDNDRQPAAYRWSDNQISAVDSDLQYFGQATFYPGSYPLGNVRRLFQTANLLGAGEEPILQVQDYRDGRIYMTVTTRTESQTVFFYADGTAVPHLGTSSAQDIRRGLEDVANGSGRVLALGFNPDRGYWADIRISDSLIERRTRMGGVPVFSSQRSATTDLIPFDTDPLDPSVLSQRQARFGDGELCAVTVDNRYQRSQPTIVFECPGQEPVITNLEGRRITIRP